MTRLVLVHGINQHGRRADELRDEWIAHLEHGMGRGGVLAGHDVSMPFYGDELKRLADGGTIAIPQGVPGPADAEEATFVAAGLIETAAAAGIGSAAIAAEQRAASAGAGPVEQGFPMNRRINAIVRLLERLSPLHGSVVTRVLKQAHAYLRKPGVGTAVDAIVRPMLEQSPSVVVAHSLGTVVSFKLLRTLALEGRPVHVPLFVTLGSPLPLMAVQAALGPEFGRPTRVDRWLNAFDPDDFITLGKPLDEANFARGIDNLSDIENMDDAHAIAGYLGDRRVAAEIRNACGIAS